MIQKEKFVTGKQILEIITSGMYSNSLMVLREYIQNSVDSIDQALSSGIISNQDEAIISIDINGQNRIITIFDNGTGIGNDQIVFLLCSLGISTKSENGNRGFRGIGRLGGLGYCDEVVFETRANELEKVGLIKWDGIKLRHLCETNNSILKVEEVLNEAISIDFRNANKNEPAHFFRVIIKNVYRFHKDQLMNIETIKAYLEQVIPVPFDKKSFSYAETIENHLSVIPGYKSYKVCLNGLQLYRPHKDSFRISTNQIDTINGIELFSFVDAGQKEICRGWYAKTNYLSALPLNVSMRGIRIRQGNIEIGNEYYLAESYLERRFSTWHIGEIHLTYATRVNVRRDDFENSKGFEAFLEQARVLGRHLSYLCRISSKKRSNCNNTELLLNQAENLVNKNFILDIEHCEKLQSWTRDLLLKIEKQNGKNEHLYDRINKIKDSLNYFNQKIINLDTALDGRALLRINKKTLLKRIASEILNHEEFNGSSEALLKKVLAPYLVRKPKEELKDQIKSSLTLH